MKYPLHAFCFADLYTYDPGASAGFDEKLLGWTTAPSTEGFSVFQIDGRKIAGMRLSTKNDSRWVPYVNVASVDDTARRALDLGATMLEPPIDTPDIARVCVLEDPEGAVFGLWESRGLAGTELESGPGSLWWIELMARDINAARNFCIALFGWAIKETMQFETVNTYTLFQVDGRSVCGAMQYDPEWGMTPRWLVYFEVTNHDEAARLACESGGESVFWRDVPTTGRVGILFDSCGANFCVAQPLQR